MSRTPARPIPAVIPVKEEPVGTVTHYFSNIMVAVIELNKGSLNLGDKIRVKGHTTDFSQNIQSIEIEHQPVMRVNPGQSFGVRVIEPVREHDAVYRVPS